MKNNIIKYTHELGQSIWLDFIDRQIIETGNLKKLIDEEGIMGVTSNPAIFEKAISSSTDYDQDIAGLAQSGLSSEEIFFKLAINDIQKASDLFAHVYNDKVVGADGFVSLEVSPFLALDSEKTLEQALLLWKEVARKNVMIKIPATLPGLTAIRKSISEGLNINVTLIFGLERYLAVTEAYISGLEDRVAEGKSIEHIASVASFFLSRIDILIDPILEEKGLGKFKGEVATASAKQAYQIYKTVFSSDRWKNLEAKGARPQRLLWASTGNKNPDFKDTKYIEALIGKNTVNTAPLDTIQAFQDHGLAELTLENGLDESVELLNSLNDAGISLGEITQTLEDDGIEKFNAPFRKLLKAIEDQTTKS